MRFAFMRLSGIWLFALLMVSGLIAKTADQGRAQGATSARVVAQMAIPVSAGGSTGADVIPVQFSASGARADAVSHGRLATRGVYALGLTVVGLAVLYLVRGRIRIERGFSGRKVQRFTGFERSTHLLMAIAFIVLALTGSNMLYGRSLVRPLVSADQFAEMTQQGLRLHIAAGIVFIVTLLTTFVLWLKATLPDRHDVPWLLAGAGIIGRRRAPAAKFNAGQKLMFWLVLFGGLGSALSGVAALFPAQTSAWIGSFAFLGVIGPGLPASPTPLQGLQFVSAWHIITGLFLMCVLIVHLYMSTLGVEGTFRAMASGRVDESWARERHVIWAEETLAHEPALPDTPRASAAE